jgi:hypothetical protein
MGEQMSGGRVISAALTIAVALGMTACNDSGDSTATTVDSSAVTSTSSTSATAATGTTNGGTGTSTGGSTTTVSGGTTTTTPTGATTTAPPNTAPQTACEGQAIAISAGATDSVAISGDVDGDTIADVVTSYALDGVPHVHATLATGLNSDVEVPLGNADTVAIQFLDFDHALGAATPPPLAVLAVGATKAGTAVATFLTLTPEHCIRVWHNNTIDDSLFTFRISAEPIYQGLQCDGAAGSIIHSLTTAQQNPGGDWKVTVQPFGHDFTTVQPHEIENLTVPDGPDIQHQYGDLTSCGITLFP